MENITLLQGDCLDKMREIPDGCIDMVLTDPPYSSGGLFAGDRRKNTKDKYTDGDFMGAARFPDFSGDNMDQRSLCGICGLEELAGHDRCDPSGGVDMAWNCRMG